MEKHEKLRLLYIGWLTVIFIVMTVSVLVYFSYTFLGPVTTITLVAVYATLSFWLHCVSHRRRQWLGKHLKEGASDDGCDNNDVQYEIVEIIEPEQSA